MTGGCGFCTGFGQAIIRIEVDELAVIFGLRLGPDRLHRLDPLAHQLGARGEHRAVVFHLLLVPAHADAEQEAPAARPDRSRRPVSRSGSDRAGSPGRRRCRPSVSSSPSPPRSASRTDPSRRNTVSAARRRPGTASGATVGMCECSGAQTDSKPRASSAWASSADVME